MYVKVLPKLDLSEVAEIWTTYMYLMIGSPATYLLN